MGHRDFQSVDSIVFLHGELIFPDVHGLRPQMDFHDFGDYWKWHSGNMLSNLVGPKSRIVVSVGRGHDQEFHCSWNSKLKSY